MAMVIAVSNWMSDKVDDREVLECAHSLSLRPHCSYSIHSISLLFYVLFICPLIVLCAPSIISRVTESLYIAPTL